MRYRIPPHLQLSDGVIEVNRIEFEDLAGRAIDGDWRFPEPVKISVDLAFRQSISLKEVCLLPKRARVQFVLSAHGTSVRSRQVLCLQPLEERQEYRLEGEMPFGYTDDELLVRISLELAESVRSDGGGAANKGDVLWSHEARWIVGKTDSLVRVVREDLKKRGMLLPWIVEADMSDLDRSFTEAVRIVVNSSHKFGSVIDSEQRHSGMQALHKAIQWQMRDDIDRQLVQLALSDERVRELEVNEYDNSLGGVLRRRLQVLLQVGTPRQQYERYLADPLSVEREMVRRPR